MEVMNQPHGCCCPTVLCPLLAHCPAHPLPSHAPPPLLCQSHLPAGRAPQPTATSRSSLPLPLPRRPPSGRSVMADLRGWWGTREVRGRGPSPPRYVRPCLPLLTPTCLCPSRPSCHSLIADLRGWLGTRACEVRGTPVMGEDRLPPPCSQREMAERS